jgi:hypothetical protein
LNQPRLLVLHAASPANQTLSYQHGWPRAFAEDRRLDVELVNVIDPPRFRQPSRRGWDGVVLLHSVFSNERLLPERLERRVREIAAPRVWFIGNEYKLMPAKMEFAERLGLALLVSQSLSPRVHELYRERLGCAVVGIPNAGLDTKLFAPRTRDPERTIDLGYRAYSGPLYLGHDERERLAKAFESVDGLVTDVSLDPASRFDEPAWAAFLNRCKGQLGFEAGTDYFELDDALRRRINAYVDAHPDTTFAEIHEGFLAEYRDPVPCRTLSSRISEAAGTRTAQLLIEGEYDGFLQPDVHYIPLRKDLGNVDEAVEKFSDDDLRRRVAENAYMLALEELSFGALLGRFAAALRSVA